MVNYRIEFSSQFKKKLKKLLLQNRAVRQKLPRLLDALQTDPFHPRLKTHKLKGELENQFVFSVDRSIRVTFLFPDKNTILLTDIGSRDQVYR